MQAKRQLHVSAQKRTFFDRKVLEYGYSRTIALGKVIPADWSYVRITVVSKSDSTVTLEITKLLGGKPLALYKKADKGHRQDS